MSIDKEIKMQEELDKEFDSWIEECPCKEVFDEMESSLIISYSNNRDDYLERRRLEEEGSYDESAFENFREEKNNE